MEKRLVKVKGIWFDLETGKSHTNFKRVIKDIFRVRDYEEPIGTLIDWYLPVNGLMIEQIDRELISALYCVGNTELKDLFYNTKFWYINEEGYEDNYYGSHIAFYIRAGEKGIVIYDDEKEKIEISEKLQNLLTELYIRLIDIAIREAKKQLADYEMAHKECK